MPPHEIIDLSLSTDDEALPKPQHNAKGLGKVDAQFDDGFAQLSDEFDSNSHVDDVWADKPSKRRKLSPNPPVSDVLPTISRVVRIVKQGGSSKQPAAIKRHRKRYDDSDPIVFKSSATDAVIISRATKDSFKCLSSIYDGSDDEIYLPDNPAASTKLPKLTSHLSDRTIALLATLSGNGRPPARQRDSSGVSKKSSDKLITRDTISVSPSGKSRPSRPGQGPAHPDLWDANKPSKKVRLTRAEKDARAQEKERVKEAAKVQKLKEREEEQERKRLLKEEKAREKQLAADLAEVNKAKTDKKISTPEMIVDLPSSIEGKSVDTQIREFLKNLQVQATSYHSPLPSLIKWRRKVTATFNDELGRWEPIPETIQKEKHIMCILSAKEFVDLTSANPAEADGQDLEAHVLRVKSNFEDCVPVYLIEGLTAWMRKNKNTRNRAYQAAVLGQMDGAAATSQTSSKRKKPAAEYIDEDMIEDALLRLQVIHGCLIHHTAATAETAEWVANFTQHISTVPYRNKRMNMSTSFCMDVGQVKTGDDKDDTYVKMLQEIVRVTAPVAYGIAVKYPNVMSLVKGFRQEGPNALEDLKKSANKNGAFTESRIGPALSKRLYKVFMDTDPASTDL
ncbi:MAG: crossover junction endonuclease eme1 [Lasallia pustulata]|uniref:Crossover junction endonuclease eme1 n=1 Tax=Lasallia pustulata TaxID=136370 RepID=A0A5M8PGF6_9LECA|nr:MAG: crossover junction endonuclease eme1 [Lasallia pustulata]